jgi:FAD:protein FMN transferase
MRRVEEQWGTRISLDVRDVAQVSILDRVFEWFERVDDLFSTWRDDTEIMRIGRGDLNVEDASKEVRVVLAICEDLRVETDGAFDISVGGRAVGSPRPGQAPLDPSGFVKGWALEQAAAMLMTSGVGRFSLGAGGDALVRGRPDAGDPASRWRVGIQHPWERDHVAAVLSVVDAGVATSGRYERGDHIIDPRTGRPAIDLTSATVVGPDLGVADAYATAVMVRGAEDGLRWLATRGGYEGLAITPTREIVTTAGFEQYRIS